MLLVLLSREGSIFWGFYDDSICIFSFLFRTFLAALTIAIVITYLGLNLVKNRRGKVIVSMDICFIYFGTGLFGISGEFFRFSYLYL
jgi:hypothetical protein